MSDIIALAKMANREKEKGDLWDPIIDADNLEDCMRNLDPIQFLVTKQVDGLYTCKMRLDKSTTTLVSEPHKTRAGAMCNVIVKISKNRLCLEFLKEFGRI